MESKKMADNISIVRLRPMFTNIVVTFDRVDHDIYDEHGLIDTSRPVGSVKQFQRVVAVGESVRNVKVGDIVSINPSRYAVKKYPKESMKNDMDISNPVIKWNFKFVEIGDDVCWLITENDIEYIVDEWENLPDFTPRTKIVVPDNKIEV